VVWVRKNTDRKTSGVVERIMAKEELVRWGKIILIAPIALVWDATYWCIGKLYKGASWVDLVMGEKIDAWLNK